MDHQESHSADTHRKAARATVSEDNHLVEATFDKLRFQIIDRRKPAVLVRCAIPFSWIEFGYPDFSCVRGLDEFGVEHKQDWPILRSRVLRAGEYSTESVKTSNQMPHFLSSASDSCGVDKAICVLRYTREQRGPIEGTGTR